MIYISLQHQTDVPPEIEETVFDSNATANRNPFIDDFFTQVCICLIDKTICWE